MEVLDRAHNGPICSSHEWESKIILKKVREKLKEHGLEKTCAPENPINADDGLADEFYRAGFELAVEMGLLCDETERIIKVTEEELKDAIDRTPKEVTLGEGPDRITMKGRKPEEMTKPLWLSPVGIVVSEEHWIPLMLRIVQNRVVDITQGPSLDTVLGKTIISGTPYETLAGRVQAQMLREVLWRAGRPGMPSQGVITSPTVFGQLGGYGVPGGFDPKKDMALILQAAGFKTSFVQLHKVVHTINCGGMVAGGTEELIGGYAGSPEGVAVAAIAETLLGVAIHQCTASGGINIGDIRYLGSSGRDGQWTLGIGTQAMSRNTNLIVDCMTEQVAGPCTEMLLYESIVGMSNLSASGSCCAKGPRSAHGAHTNHLTPLESKFCGEIYKASAGMKRSDINEIAKKLIPKYEEKLRNPPIGKSFLDCYDLKVNKPSNEWQEIYEKVWKELEDLGVERP